MKIEQYYKLLKISDTATNEEITSSYKKLAQLYHPDKNRDRIEWATTAMSNLNIAYTNIMSYRFEHDSAPLEKKEKKQTNRTHTTQKTQKPEKNDIDSDFESDILTFKFVKIRESAKDSLYRYFQYKLYNIPLREKVSNTAIFNTIVFSLRKSYHKIQMLSRETSDSEFIEHFKVFNSMLFNFYRASECLNILDSYKNIYDVEAYRLYKNGDEYLHESHKEIFFDRHNRGFFKSDLAYSLLLKAEKIFQSTIKLFPKSSWAVETSIKLDYVQSLKKYLDLFFTN